MISSNCHPKDQKFITCKQFSWSPQQEQINQLFLRAKLQQQQSLPPFFFQKDTIKHLPLMRSKPIYKLLDDMPKGVLHHFHLECMQDLPFMLKHVINYPGIYLNKQRTSWQYGTEQQANEKQWVRVEQFRKEFGSQREFEEGIMKVTQITQQQAEQYSYGKEVWKIFEQKIMAFNSVFHQEDLYKEYMRNMVAIWVANGYQRLELRNRLFPMKRRNPKESLTVQQVIRLTEQIEKELQVKYPFLSIGLIPFGLKMYSDKELEDYLRLAYTVDSPLIVGFDLAQQQDRYPEFDHYQPVITRLEKQFGRRFQGVYHAGQTKRILNHNIQKVLTHGSKRIGHGLNLLQHSYLIPSLISKNTCIQVCPLSNQFLGYVYNLTQHPAIAYYHLGLPITLSPDDPSRFGYVGSTPDFYVAAHGFGFDLKDMKLLGVYSILHALCGEGVREELMRGFNERWRRWMSGVGKRIQGKE